jgi:hypothetical protein
MIKNDWSRIINSVQFESIKNMPGGYIAVKNLFIEYAQAETNRGVITQSIVDLENKCYQLNEKGFWYYIERTLPKKHFVKVLKNEVLSIRK